MIQQTRMILHHELYSSWIWVTGEQLVQLVGPSIVAPSPPALRVSGTNRMQFGRDVICSLTVDQEVPTISRMVEDGMLFSWRKHSATRSYLGEGIHSWEKVHGAVAVVGRK